MDAHGQSSTVLAVLEIKRVMHLVNYGTALRDTIGLKHVSAAVRDKTTHPAHIRTRIRHASVVRSCWLQETILLGQLSAGLPSGQAATLEWYVIPASLGLLPSNPLTYLYLKCYGKERCIFLLSSDGGVCMGISLPYERLETVCLLLSSTSLRARALISKAG